MAPHAVGCKGQPGWGRAGNEVEWQLACRYSKSRHRDPQVGFSLMPKCVLSGCLLTGADEVVQVWVGRQVTLLPGQWLAAPVGQMHSTLPHRITAQC